MPRVDPLIIADLLYVIREHGFNVGRVMVLRTDGRLWWHVVATSTASDERWEVKGPDETEALVTLARQVGIDLSTASRDR